MKKVDSISGCVSYFLTIMVKVKLRLRDPFHALVLGLGTKLQLKK
jgi:hypothetical protein